MRDAVVVSVVIPIRNEEKYIEQCILSLMKQDYPKEHMEFIFVDGASEDRTKAIVSSFTGDGLVKLLDNPRRTVPFALNIGISQSTGKYIIRLDAHSEYAPDYISQCVFYLDNTDADNVGGYVTTKGRGYIGEAIALMLSCSFGVGNSYFRTHGRDGYVDTVPFGAFRRSVFDKIGLFDERLTRNQDNEMNWRIRKNGGKIYLSKDIQSDYYCRDTARGIGKMAFNNGCWNIITYYLFPGSMSIRHFIPLFFVISVVGAIINGFLFKNAFLNAAFAAEFTLYTLLDLFFSLKNALATKLKYLPALIVLFPFFHICYGFGSLVGIVRALRWKRCENKCTK